MFDQILDSLRKAIDSTFQLHQELCRHWFQQWSQVTEAPLPVSVLVKGWADRVRAAQAKWAEAVTDLLTRERENFDSQYRASIRAIGDVSRVAEAKDVGQFCERAEGLWRQGVETLKTAVDSRLCDLQATARKTLDAMALVAAAVRVGR